MGSAVDSLAIAMREVNTVGAAELMLLQALEGIQLAGEPLVG